MTSTASRLSVVQREIESLEVSLNPQEKRMKNRSTTGFVALYQ
jgi:hypothetical protein